MVAEINEKENAPPKLATEGPLLEKDVEGQAIERAQKLGQEALAKWRRLKEKIVNHFKK